MADGTGPGRVTPSGVALAALLLILIVVSLWFFVAKPYWWTPLASQQGADIDFIFTSVLWVTGIAFVVIQGLLGYFIARYGAKGSERASYWHDNSKAEAILLIGTAAILTVLVFMGQRVWASVYFSDVPENALTIQVTGEQFAWNFHYAGPDGAFGRQRIELISPTNTIGLDRTDPAAKDDLLSINQMHMVANRPVRVRLRSKDVIHSFFLPNLRVKQDAVPGMGIEIWFTPNLTGNYEIACAELCGLGHYRMKAFLTVDASQDVFDTWLREQTAQQ